MRKAMGIPVRILALCLCLALAAGAACAEEITMLYAGEDATLGYDCTLPDGRLLLSGIKETTADSGPKAWLVCMNPDRTVSWEYVETDDREDWYAEAAVLKDGTIALAWTRYLDDEGKIVAKFFTPDGQPTGKTVEMPGGGLWPDQATPSYLVVERQMHEDGKEEAPWFETQVLDWDGNVIVPWKNEYAEDSGMYRIIEEADGVVFFGAESMKVGRAKILKKESPLGGVIWENALYETLPGIPDPEIVDLVKTEDGGYAALVGPAPSEGPGGEWVYEGPDHIVKLDANGAVCWVRSVGAENGERCRGIAAAGGRIVTCAVPKVRWYPRIDRPVTAFWFDLDGNSLGKSELKLNEEDFPLLREAAASPENAGITVVPVADWGQIVPMPDGFRARVVCFAVDTDDDSAESVSVLGYVTAVLVRIPEAE